MKKSETSSGLMQERLTPPYWKNSRSNPLKQHADGKGNYTTPQSSGVRFSPFINMFGSGKKKTGDWLNLTQQNAVNHHSFSTVSPGFAQFNCSVPHTDVATRRPGTRVSFDEQLHTTRSTNALQSRKCCPASYCLRHLHLIQQLDWVHLAYAPILTSTAAICGTTD